MVQLSLGEEYWENFELKNEDVEFLYNHLLEVEEPLTPRELVAALIGERLRSEKQALEQQRSTGGDVYLPKDTYQPDQKLIFPALNWKRGQVLEVRAGQNPELGESQVIQVAMEDGEQREFAAGLPEHKLNDPPAEDEQDDSLDPDAVLETYEELLTERLEEDLNTNPDFVRIAGRWFPRALLVDVNAGHMNLAEAVLDMNGGGPLPTPELLQQIELTSDVNPKLLEFSLDHALQEDLRFDEVGPSGQVLWFLNRLEPPEVLEPPQHLRYAGIEYDRTLLTKPMLDLERQIDDELSPLQDRGPVNEVELALIFPHWRSGTLPLSSRLRRLLPTAYEAPRIRFTLVDGDSGEQFPGWVVREKRYVYGLQDWYKARGVMPGSLIKLRRGQNPGEVIIRTDNRRSAREWVRTVLVGSDGGIVFAMLKQPVSTTYEERMAIAVPDAEALAPAWTRGQREPFEKTVHNNVRELAKLNPQSHVHASELYAAVNVVRRCPPGPLLAVLASQPQYVHVGDLHFRINDSEGG